VRAYLPPGVEPDRWNGATHVSLVALHMRDVQVLGWRVPGFRAHLQVNLRVYARLGPHRAVCFVRELVPSRLIAVVGRLRYGEPFQMARIQAQVAESGDQVTVEYRFGPRTATHRIAVTGSRAAAVPPDSSFEHYLKERTRGCRADRHGRLRTFRVVHQPWPIREVRRVDYDVDFAELYGPEWSFMNAGPPVSVILAIGSQVVVETPRHPAS
jgi:uncharacterized protein YqjF (DUF2071 family)